MSGGRELGQIEPVEQEQVQVTEETMVQVRGTGRKTVCKYNNNNFYFTHDHHGT